MANKLTEAAGLLIERGIPFRFKANGKVVANGVRLFIAGDGSKRLLATQFEHGEGIDIALDEVVSYVLGKK